MTETSRKAKANGRVNDKTRNEQLKRIQDKRLILNDLRYQINQTTRSVPGLTHDGNRDIWKIAGYVPYNTVQYEQYRQIYDRTLGGRIVEKFVQSTWQKPPAVSEDEQTDTPFTEDVEKLAKKFDLWETMSTADTQASIGEFGIILIGLKDEPTDDDGQAIGASNLSQPVDPASLNNLDDLLYLQPYGQDTIAAIELNGDASSPRFGQAEKYTIQFNTVESSGGTAISFGETPGVTAHWTRVIHLAEDTLDNSVIGTPKMRRSLNILQSIQQTIAGSSEAYWRIADRGMAVNVESDVSVSDADLDSIEDQLDKYINEGRRMLTFQNAKITELGGKDVDPSGMFGVEEKVLAATSNIPNRIFFGSERGNLASGQDAKEWAGTITSRQRTYAEPVVRDLLDRLIVWGILAAPKGGVGAYDLGQPDETGVFTWPSILENNPKENAEISNIYASALNTAKTAQTDGAVLENDEVRAFGNLPATGETEDEMMKREDEALGEVEAGVTPGTFESLNGAQITSVLEVLDRLAGGFITDVAASALLRSVGIPPDLVDTIVSQQKARPSIVEETV